MKDTIFFIQHQFEITKMWSMYYWCPEIVKNLYKHVQFMSSSLSCQNMWSVTAAQVAEGRLYRNKMLSEAFIRQRWSGLCKFKTYQNIYLFSFFSLKMWLHVVRIIIYELEKLCFFIFTWNIEMKLFWGGLQNCLNIVIVTSSGK